jgi:hypothetical protein
MFDVSSMVVDTWFSLGPLVKSALYSVIEGTVSCTPVSNERDGNSWLMIALTFTPSHPPWRFSHDASCTGRNRWPRSDAWYREPSPR